MPISSLLNDIKFYSNYKENFNSYFNNSQETQISLLKINYSSLKGILRKKNWDLLFKYFWNCAFDHVELPRDLKEYKNNNTRNKPIPNINQTPIIVKEESNKPFSKNSNWFYKKLISIKKLISS